MAQMLSGLSKYFREDQQRPAPGGGRMVGRRPSDGIPVVGHSQGRSDLTGEQADELMTVCDYEVGMFRMWVPQEVLEYRRVLDHAANGQYHIPVRREILAEPEETGLPGQHIKVWLEWKVYYAQAESAPSPLFGGAH